MSILDNVKALVEPLVFKKDGSVSCGFGVRIQMSVILDRENWIKIEDGIKTIEAELARLRAVNAVLVEALAGFAMGVIIPPLMTEQARQLMQWQDAAREALSRAAQAKQEPETCVWRGNILHGYQVQCGYLPIFGDGVSTGKCPGCGKRVEVKK